MRTPNPTFCQQTYARYTTKQLQTIVEWLVAWLQRDSKAHDEWWYNNMTFADYTQQTMTTQWRQHLPSCPQLLQHKSIAQGNRHASARGGASQKIELIHR